MPIRTFAQKTISWLFFFLLGSGAANSQQRPVPFESASMLAPGTAYGEVGFSHFIEQSYPLSGLEGDLTQIGMLRFDFSYGENVELQMEGTVFDVLQIKHRYPAFNSYNAARGRTITGDVGDFTVWTKFRIISEYTSFMSSSIRFGVELPNASNESGLGVDQFDFYSTLLFEKHLAGMQCILNAGLGILGDPTILSSQHDMLTYAYGQYIPIGSTTFLVGEVAGRAGHHGPGVPLLVNGMVGVQSSADKIIFKISGVLGFSPADHSKGIQCSAGYNFDLLDDAR